MEHTFEKELFKVVTKDLDKIQSKYSYFNTSLKELTVDNEIKLNIGSDIYKFTSSSFKRFCKVLGIPSPFVKHIPIDLFQTNVDRLKEEYDIPIKVCHRNGVFVNLLPMKKKSHFQNISSDMLVEYFNSDLYEIAEMRIGDFGTSIDVLFKDLGEFEVKKGEVVSFGYRLDNPFTMLDVKLNMNIFMRQLVCTNGMVIDKSFGSGSVNLQKVFEKEEDYLDAFKNNIDMSIGTDFNASTISKMFVDMTNTYVKYRFLKTIFGKLKNVSDDFLKNVTKVDLSVEEEKIFYSNKFREDEAEDSDFQFFDLIYNITDKAKSLDVYDKMNMEAYASKIISLYNKQLLLYSKKEEE